MQLALGKSKEDEMKDNLHELSELISGNCALLLTARELEETQEYFNALSHKDYARSGFTSTETITLPAGELKDKPHSMLEEFRYDSSIH
jgi:mRNA turnover protein 4